MNKKIAYLSLAWMLSMRDGWEITFLIVKLER